MKFSDIDRNIRNGIVVFTISGILIVLFSVVISHLDLIFSLIGKALDILMPFLVGILFAVILQPLRTLAETKWLKNLKCKDRTRRKLATGITMIIFMLCFVSFFAVLIPQLISSIQNFMENMDGYFRSLNTLIESLHLQDAGITDTVQELTLTLSKSLYDWLLGAQGGLSTIVSYSVSFVKTIVDFFIGFIITIYILTDEERFKKQLKKILYTICKETTADSIILVVRLTGNMFKRFVFGQAMDSIVVGIVCWFGCTVFKIPYAVLIGFVVGVTNMIPIFGPFIGAVPCGIILLLVKPIAAVEFAAFILVLQQIDGNIVAPHILGDSLGLPALWVMFAIIVGGSLFGIVGMFLGVPLFSVIYYLVAEAVDNHIYRHRIKIDEK